MGYTSTKTSQTIETFRLFFRVRDSQDTRLTHKVHLWSRNISRSWDKICIEKANILNLRDIVDSTYSNRHKLYSMKNKLYDIDKEEWVNVLYNDRNEENGNKLRTYRKYKNCLTASSYVKTVSNRQYRRVLSNFRSGCLPLAIETGRWTKPKTPLNERKCKFCDRNVAEDEIHFLLDCNFYSDLQYNLIENANSLSDNFINLNLEDKFIFIMSNDTIQPFLAKTLHSMFYRRKYCK